MHFIKYSVNASYKYQVDFLKVGHLFFVFVLSNSPLTESNL